MNEEQKKMAAVFNEWAKRYAANPSEFDSILGSDGQPPADYGESCALYYSKLVGEIQS